MSDRTKLADLNDRIEAKEQAILQGARNTKDYQELATLQEERAQVFQRVFLKPGVTDKRSFLRNLQNNWGRE